MLCVVCFVVSRGVISFVNLCFACKGSHCRENVRNVIK